MISSRSSLTPSHSTPRPLRSLAEPERHTRRRAMRIFHQHLPRRLDALDAPARVAEQNHVARARVHGEVLIERRDLHTLRLQDHGEQRRIRNRAAIRDRDHARPAPRLQPAVHAVAQQVRAIASAARFDPIAQDRRPALQTARASGRDTDRRAGTPRRANPCPTAPRRTPRQSAASARRCGCGGISS